MLTLVEQKRTEIERLCRDFGVRRLELFGSAMGGAFDPSTSDIDLLVEFELPAKLAGSGGLTRFGYADSYFGLLEALEALLGRKVDLVSLRTLRNPYFIQGIASSRQVLYAA